MLKLKLQYWCEELTHLKRHWCWEWLKAGGEAVDRGWGGWMASVTQWTKVWVSSRSLWWPGKLGVLQSMGSQIDMTEQLNWTEILFPSSCSKNLWVLWLFFPKGGQGDISAESLAPPTCTSFSLPSSSLYTGWLVFGFKSLLSHSASGDLSADPAGL